MPTAYKITSNIVNWVFRSRLTVHVLHRAIYLLSFCIKLEVSWEWNYTLWRSMWVGGGDGEKEWNGKPTLWLLLQFIITDWEGIFICFTLRNLFFYITCRKSLQKIPICEDFTNWAKIIFLLLFVSKSVIEFILIQRFRFLKCILRIGFIGFNWVGEKVLRGDSTLSPISDKMKSAPFPPLPRQFKDWKMAHFGRYPAFLDFEGWGFCCYIFFCLRLQSWTK